ncbi:hypothetical protein, partial [Salmonella sp. SAL4356]|uniref:hypothetical protein n=1 Tax=Salmonella sp. SAL4356 TaxID=3159877 RepID=UPI00397C8788
SQIADALSYGVPRIGAHADGLPTLVVDNAERLSRPFYDVLDLWMQGRPDHLRVVVLSRTQPALPLHRYRLEGTVAELTY